MLRFISFSFIWVMAGLNSMAQITSYELKHSEALHAQHLQDTAKVKAWLNRANYYYNRISSLKLKQDSAFFYIAVSKKLSIALHFNKGLQDAITLEAKILHKQRQLQILQGNNNPSITAIDSFEKTTIKALDLYADKTAKADALMAMANAYNWRMEGAERQVAFYKEAATLYNDPAHQKQRGIALLQLGQAQLHSEVLDEAGISFIEGTKILSALKYPQMQMAYHGLSHVNISTGKFDEGTKYGLEAVRIAERVGDTSLDMADVYKNVGYCYEIAGDFDNAIVYFRKALEIGKRNHSVYEIYASTSEVAKILVITSTDSAILILRNVLRQYPLPAGNLAHREVYLQLLRSYNRKKQLKQAEIYARKVLDFANALPPLSLNKSYWMSPVIDYYIIAKEYPKAIQLLSICKNIEERNHQYPALMGVYRRLYRIDSSLNDYKSALHHFKLWRNLRDSLNSLTQEKEIAGLRLEFHTEQQKKDIALLQKENHLNAERLNRSAFERNVVIAFAVLLFIIFCLLYYQFSLKKEANRRINSKNHILEKLLQEKEWLLKEVHHRVKNNLQIVVSLLESQASKLQDEALDAIHESQHRVFAISLVHKKLYQAENIKTVEMTNYIPELVGYINSMLGKSSTLSFEYNIANIELDVSDSVPIGLIINELVTNAIKYAFPVVRPELDIIRITMQSTEMGRIQMIVEDNGIGLPTHLLQGGGTGLGLRLLFGLTDDLDGSLIITNNKGTKVVLEFSQYKDAKN